MENDAYRTTVSGLDERCCAFEKSILTNNAACSQAHKLCTADHEGVSCGSDAALADCLALLELLRRQARFALHIADERAVLTHAKAMRIQVGGLRGIQAALTPDEPVPGRIADIHRLVQAALAQYGDLSQLPFPEIVRQIAAYQVRRRLRGW